MKTNYDLNSVQKFIQKETDKRSFFLTKNNIETKDDIAITPLSSYIFPDEWLYFWYKPHTEDDIMALNSEYSSDDMLTENDIDEWVCVVVDFYADYSFVRMSDIVKEAKKFFTQFVDR